MRLFTGFAIGRVASANAATSRGSARPTCTSSAGPRGCGMDGPKPLAEVGEGNPPAASLPRDPGVVRPGSLPTAVVGRGDGVDRHAWGVRAVRGDHARTRTVGTSTRSRSVGSARRLRCRSRRPAGCPSYELCQAATVPLDRVTPLDAFVEVSDVDEGCVHGAGPRVRKLGAGAGDHGEPGGEPAVGGLIPPEGSRVQSRLGNGP
jgi:hypothetical protein